MLSKHSISINPFNNCSNSLKWELQEPDLQSGSTERVSNLTKVTQPQGQQSPLGSEKVAPGEGCHVCELNQGLVLCGCYQDI